MVALGTVLGVAATVLAIVLWQTGNDALPWGGLVVLTAIMSALGVSFLAYLQAVKEG